MEFPNIEACEPFNTIRSATYTWNWINGIFNSELCGGSRRQINSHVMLFWRRLNLADNRSWGILHWKIYVRLLRCCLFVYNQGRDTWTQCERWKPALPRRTFLWGGCRNVCGAAKNMLRLAWMIEHSKPFHHLKMSGARTNGAAGENYEETQPILKILINECISKRFNWDLATFPRLVMCASYFQQFFWVRYTQNCQLDGIKFQLLEPPRSSHFYLDDDKCWNLALGSATFGTEHRNARPDTHHTSTHTHTHSHTHTNTHTHTFRERKATQHSDTRTHTLQQSMKLGSRIF